MSRSNGGVAELRQLCLATFSQRHGGMLVPLAQQRLDEELAAIEGQGRVKDFLAVADVRRWAGEKAIALRLVAAGGNSLAAFCLGLTEVDPVRHRLVSQRFVGQADDEPIPFCWEVEEGYGDPVRSIVSRHLGADFLDRRFDFNTMPAEAAVPYVTVRLRGCKGHAEDLARIPLNDQRAFALLRGGDTAGIFQRNGTAAAEQWAIPAPQSLDELAVATALDTIAMLESIAEGRDHTIDQLIAHGILATCPAEFQPNLGDNHLTSGVFQGPLSVRVRGSGSPDSGCGVTGSLVRKRSAIALMAHVM